MKKLYLFHIPKLITLVYSSLIVSLLLFASQASAQSFEWTRSGESDEVRSAVTSDGAGNSYLLTSFSGRISFGSYSFANQGGPNTTDLCLVKRDKDGNVQWARQIGGQGNEELGDVTISAYGNYLYLTGSFEKVVRFGSHYGILFNPLISRGGKEIFVARYNADTGILVWARRAGGAYSDRADGIFTDKYGEKVFITGTFGGTAYFNTSDLAYTLNSAGGSDCYYAKYDRDGNFQHAQRWGEPNSDFSSAIAVNSYTGAIYVTGGSTTTANPYVVNFYLLKMDESGHYLWQRRAIQGFSTFTTGNDLVIDNTDGTVYVTGMFTGNSSTGGFNLGGEILNSNGSFDAFVAKYGSDGAVLWAKSFGGSYYDAGESIDEYYGSIYVSGTFSNTVEFDHNTHVSGRYNSYNIFIAQMAGRSGDFVWSESLGDDDTIDYGKGEVSVTDENHIYLSGHYGGTITLGSTTLNGSHTFLTKITPPPITYITNFWLVNADTNEEIRRLYRYDAIRYSEVGTKNIAIKILTSPGTVGSVVSRYNSGTPVTENAPPYAYPGNSFSGSSPNYHPFSPSAGTHRLESTPYSGANGTGVKGRTKVLFFTIVDDLGARTAAHTEKGNAVATKGLPTNELAFAVYPNPVVTTSTMEFVATEDGPAKLALYNVQGSLVQTIFTGQTQAGKRYRFSIDRQALRSQLYFARLETEQRKHCAAVCGKVRCANAKFLLVRPGDDRAVISNRAMLLSALP